MAEITNTQKATELIMALLGDYSERKRIYAILNKYLPESHTPPSAPVDKFIKDINNSLDYSHQKIPDNSLQEGTVNEEVYVVVPCSSGRLPEAEHPSNNYSKNVHAILPDGKPIVTWYSYNGGAWFHKDVTAWLEKKTVSLTVTT